MPIPAQTSKLVTSILKDFLWGFNDAGGRETPLVAWKRISAPRVEGGLGIKKILVHSQTQLCKWVLASLKALDLEWTTLFYENLKKTTWENGIAIRQAGYTMEDRIMLGTIRAFN